MTAQRILQWLRAHEKQQSYDILLVQTVRNALMGAGVVASTSLVALIGVVSVSRVFSSSQVAAMHYGNWPTHLSSVILALALTESLLALRAFSRAGFGITFEQVSEESPVELEKFANYLADALRQLSRAAVTLSVGVAVAVLGSIFIGL